ncbi:dienelactone hydrolase family protein [Archangium lansingense]|uniref:dienelactone hydrolase family protein n=1 Tax=Archangium lansingense TaxID=2995310 RepID=UPI003B7F3CE7
MAVFRREMVLPQDDETLVGQLFISERPMGVVVWGNDDTSERYRRQTVRLAEELAKCGLASLLFGLWTEVEEGLQAGWGVDDEARLQRAARRLERTCALLARDAQTQGMRLGLFGTGSGAPASLLVAARHPAELSAIACCGGRPSLAGAAAARVRVPTLIVVGSEDEHGLLEAQRLSSELAGEHSLRLIPGASSTLHEPGAWEDAVRITGEWFHDHFRAAVEPRSDGWADAEGRFV